jgi:ribosome biogenesis GTPase
MTLEDLGYNTELENYRKNQKLDSFEVGRVISEHKERYIVKTAKKEYDAELVGNLRFSATNRSDFPAVGDWVAISEYDINRVLIHSLFPRKTTIERSAVGKYGEKQIIATNVDFAFIIQAVDRDFNINRIERYLTICNSSNVRPIIILNKIDLIDDSELAKLVSEVSRRINNTPIIAISNETEDGIETVKQSIISGMTYCLLGSSGVGKSTLSNILSGSELMKTSAISESTNKGRHITSHRELIVLESGGILIDNPGIRDVGIADSEGGLENTFEALINIAGKCKFNNCTHTNEKGCAVLTAVKNGEVDKESYSNYMKLIREKDHFESTIAERRKKDKDFGKMVKTVIKTKDRNKY